MGKQWHEQSLSKPPYKILQDFKDVVAQRISGGKPMGRQIFDPNSPEYTGLSSKELVIVGAMLLGVKPGDPAPEFHECLDVIFEVAGF